MPQIVCKEKAGCGGRQQPATTINRRGVYPSTGALSRPPAPNCGVAALGLLVVLLALQDGLAAKDRPPAVTLADRWARQIVQARHVEAT